MFRPTQFVLAVWLTMGASGLLWGQAAATPPLPAWQDGASVYLKTDRPAEARTAEYMSDGGPAQGRPPAPAVVAAYQESPATTSAAAPAAEPRPDVGRDSRHLAPPRNHPLAPGRTLSDRSRRLLPGFGLPMDSMYTMLAALALVIGLFLLCAWALRRGVRSSSVVLPGEVVSVLGRVPLAARQFAQLLRVGNKLVLVSVTPSGAETLAEVTDPVEVDRLLGICQQLDPRSTTREFEQVFRQLAAQPAPDAFIEREAPVPQNVYQAYRGGTTRG
jgi:flagellar biogenesis protein FliO